MLPPGPPDLCLLCASKTQAGAVTPATMTQLNERKIHFKRYYNFVMSAYVGYIAAPMVWERQDELNACFILRIYEYTFN